ncbi:hypothetical protein ACFSJU_14670 [Paradesertivirga mongoliensis]|uniref:Tetratricopeptide repeat protein n=1 Tax=Paradesertivirga mongoliensis TaxID=2100740 RepID=A0ABW4ZQ02_9SPHI|nr:tetratricopeptide repeat protein [Pedobacter mongoliensis]
MRALILTLIFTAHFASGYASYLKDTTNEVADSTSIVLNQPDSVTIKVVYHLLEASELKAEKPAEALKHYRSAVTINKVKDPLWEANIRLEMGKLLNRLKSKDAIAQFRLSDALYRKKAYIPGRTDAITAIANVQEKSGLFTEALKNYNLLYTIQDKAHEYVMAGNTALYVADVYLKKKNYPEALKYAEMAKKEYYKVCRKDSLGSTFYRIAYIKRMQKSPKQAEHFILNEALSYYRSSDDQEGRLKSFNFLASLYQDQKRYSEAKWFYLQANNQARLMNDVPSTITSLINLGVTKILIGDLALAKQDITDAEELCRTDSIYLPIMKKAKVKYATLFKKLDQPVLANSSTKKPKITATKPKNPVKKTKVVAKPTAAADTDKKDIGEIEVIESR